MAIGSNPIRITNPPTKSEDFFYSMKKLFSIHENISKAETLPAWFYRSDDVFQHQKEKIFSRSWQYVANTDEMKEEENIFPKTFLENYLNEPIVFTKKKNEIQCLSNVCTHRGNLLAEKSCHANQFRCRYHGRKFQIDGKFISMPEFEDVENFPSEKDNLSKIPFAQWGKLLFASIHAEKSFEEIIRTVKERLHWLPFDKFVFAPEHSTEYLLHANWMLYCDNYLEGFHIPFVHPDLNKQLDFGKYRNELFDSGNLQIGVSKDDEHVFQLPNNSVDFGHHVGAYYFFLFPNLMLNFYPWGLSLNVVHPLKVNLTKIEYFTFVWKKELMGNGAGGNPNQVEMEDEEIVLQVQKGIQSRVYERGRYSVTQEKGVHQFHRFLSEKWNDKS